MERSRYTLWYEDLERHRQPSLYYLSSEDEEGGPHLICDWNGAPTDLQEFNLDLLSNMTYKKKLIDNSETAIPSKDLLSAAQTKYVEHLNNMSTSSEDDINTYSTIHSMIPKSNCSQTLLTEDDGSHFDFLTVPPVARSLLKRLLKSSLPTRPSPILEEPELSTASEVASSKSSKSGSSKKKISVIKENK